MATPASSKKQIVESIKESTNILVTVSDNPSVDELSAALGLTIFLNNLGKHATAIASGKMPPAINFLEPDKTFEATADSLRDFIIALDKEKADHLRYKVEGDVVKIFITPYRTTITKSDLEFSQGDYNVELVLALNVASDKDLDAALSAHGKILHDATVGVITAGEVKSSLGTASWHEKSVSGVSEMATDIIGELKTPKAALDEQIATALLTGIVASTDRFSNDLTSSKVMTMAAELMAAGANQQLIVSNLQDTDKTEPEEPKDDTGGGSEVEDKTTLKVSRDDDKVAEPDEESDSNPDEPAEDGSVGLMKIERDREGNVDQAARQVMQESQADAARAAEAQLDRVMDRQAEKVADLPPTEPVEPVAPVEEQPEPSEPVAVTPPDITEDLRQATEEINAANPEIQPSVAAVSSSEIQPTVGGTLNATTAQAAADKQREIEQSTNRTILTHGKPLAAQEPTVAAAPLNAAMTESNEPSVVDIFATPPNSPLEPAPVETVGSPLPPLGAPELSTAPSEAPIMTPEPVAPIPTTDEQQAMNDVNAAFAAQPQPEPVTMPTLPAEPVQPAPTLQEIEMGSQAGLPPMGDATPAFPAMPPMMPDFSSLPPLPPLPPAPAGVDMASMPDLSNLPQPEANVGQAEFNPSQFQIPNQP